MPADRLATTPSTTSESAAGSVTSPKVWLWAGLEALLAFGLAMFHIGSASLWYDEGVSAVVSGASWGEITRVARHTDPNMTGYSAALHLWRIPFGSSEAALRSLSALGVAAAVLMLVGLARRLYDDRTAIVAGLVLAVAPHVQLYGQQARSYGLLVFAVIAATYCFVRVLDDRSTAWAVGYGFVAAYATYLHLFALWVVFAHALALLFLPPDRRPWRALIAAAATLGVLLIPLASWVLGTTTDLHQLQRPGIADLFRTWSVIAGGNIVTVVLGLLVVVAVVNFVRDAARLHRSRALFADGLALVWLIAPFATTFVVSLVFDPMFLDRYLIISVPALALVAATTLVRLPWRAVAVGALVVLVAGSLAKIARNYDAEIQDWRSAVGYMTARTTPDDGVVVCHAERRPPVDYYVERTLPRRDRPRALSPRGDWGSLHDDGVSDEIAASWVNGGPDRIWLVGDPDHCGFQLEGRERAVSRTFHRTAVERYDRTR